MQEPRVDRARERARGALVDRTPVEVLVDEVEVVVDPVALDPLSGRRR
jgi:hypothetical protein